MRQGGKEYVHSHGVMGRLAMQGHCPWSRQCFGPAPDSPRYHHTSYSLPAAQLCLAARPCLASQACNHHQVIAHLPPTPGDSALSISIHATSTPSLTPWSSPPSRPGHQTHHSLQATTCPCPSRHAGALKALCARLLTGMSIPTP